MAADPVADVLRWVGEGEQLFGRTLQMLHRCRELETAVEALTRQTDSLQQENQVLRRDLEQLRVERLETADALKAFADHVTRLTTMMLQGLAKRAS